MKKSLIFLFFLIVSKSLFSQNLLPTIWQISFADTAKNSLVQYDTKNWKPVNLSLSWERQGFSGILGKCCLTTNFVISSGAKAEDYTFSIGLHCDVSEVYINDVLICRNLPNNFWTDRHSKSTYTLPHNCLRSGNNRIKIFASNLSYTGGRSYNTCSISPLHSNNAESVKINIPKKEHLFSKADKDIVLQLKYSVQKYGQLTLCVDNDFHDTLFVKTYPVNPKDSLLQVDLSKVLTKPGFYECTATMHAIGYSSHTQWLAISPEKIQCKTDTISGFKQYWKEALKELGTVEPDFKMHKVDSLSVGARDGYVVEMRSLGNLVIRGYYFVPRTAGKHAVVLQVPGYSYGFQYLDSFLKNKENVAELALCVRGHGISADIFNPGFGVPGIWGYKLYSEKENAYRSIYMDCVRAVEFLLSRPEIDSSRIAVMGGSQGGGLTLAMAGLCADKIAACAYFDPFPCDINEFIDIRTVCRFELKNYLKYYNNPCSFEDAMHVQNLLDTKGMASWIKCPVLYATGLFDDDCPSHVGFAAYNRIHAPKEFRIYPNDSHLNESDYGKEFWAFFKQQLKF